MPGEPPHVAELERFLAERGERLLRTAILLAGGQEEGKDLLQAALERLFRHWRDIRGDPEGYLRRTLAHLATDCWRRHARWRGKSGLLSIADPGYLPDPTTGVDDRDQLVRLLMRLPVRQRTAIVLRYWEDLTETETAVTMGCSVGSVKSATSRGLRRLRELSDPGRVPHNAGSGKRGQP
jgi:RNA polymerase sigma-70 factor (sigma-E family)